MKRMLAAGAGRIYQVARVFRLDELGPLHNPEFTLVEWYQPGDGLDAGMQLTSDLCEAMLGSIKPRPMVAVRNATSGRGFMFGPAERITYSEAFERHVGVDPHAADGATLAALAKKLGIEAPASLSTEDRDGWLDLLMVERIQPRLGVERPALLYDYPASQAALARIRHEEGNPPVAERFELYIDGVEIANGYHELLDAAELRARNAQVNAQRRADGKPALPDESRLLAAMESGLPSSVGVALGFDRLVMAVLGAKTIAEVIAFPFDRA
jgi:lysyl-tRNA synthetase class 2